MNSKDRRPACGFFQSRSCAWPWFSFLEISVYLVFARRTEMDEQLAAAFWSFIVGGEPDRQPLYLHFLRRHFLLLRGGRAIIGYIVPPVELLGRTKYQCMRHQRRSMMLNFVCYVYSGWAPNLVSIFLLCRSIYKP